MPGDQDLLWTELLVRRDELQQAVIHDPGAHVAIPQIDVGRDRAHLLLVGADAGRLFFLQLKDEPGVPVPVRERVHLLRPAVFVERVGDHPLHRHARQAAQQRLPVEVDQHTAGGGRHRDARLGHVLNLDPQGKLDPVPLPVVSFMHLPGR